MPDLPAATGLDGPDASLAAVDRRMRALAGDAPGRLTPVARAAADHLAAGGGRIRARLALSAASALGLEDEMAVSAAATVELLHNASLVHDDLQDGDRTRRGAPAVWAAYGADAAICTGDMLLSAAYAAAAPLVRGGVPQAPGHIHAAVAETIHGQIADRRAAAAPPGDVASFARTARAKAGPFLALPLELPLLAAGYADAIESAAEAGRAFALAYQIADDLADTPDDAPRGGANVVCVLARARGLSDRAARQAAAAIAVEALAEARTAAAALPDGAGAALTDPADALAARLAKE